MSLRAVLKIFPECHLKIIHNPKELVHGRVNYLISEAISQNITFSSFDYIASNSSNCSTHASLRFTQCFVHLYLDDELTGNAEDYFTLEDTMYSNMVAGESPHHFIFLGEFSYSEEARQSKLRFYRNSLQFTFAKGLIFSVDHNKNLTTFSIQLVCIICEETLLDLDLSTVVLPDLQEQVELRRNQSLRKDGF